MQLRLSRIESTAGDPLFGQKFAARVGARGGYGVGWSSSFMGARAAVAMTAEQRLRAQSNLDAGSRPRRFLRHLQRLSPQSAGTQAIERGLLAGTLYHRRAGGRGHGRLSRIGGQRSARGPTAQAARSGCGEGGSCERDREQTRPVSGSAASPDRAAGTAAAPDGAPGRGGAGQAARDPGGAASYPARPPAAGGAGQALARPGAYSGRQATTPIGKPGGRQAPDEQRRCRGVLDASRRCAVSAAGRGRGVEE